MGMMIFEGFVCLPTDVFPYCRSDQLHQPKTLSARVDYPMAVCINKMVRRLEGNAAKQTGLESLTAGEKFGGGRSM
jgi:hypothetical protein